MSLEPNPCWPEGKEEYIAAMGREAVPPPALRLWPDDAEVVLKAVEAEDLPIIPRLYALDEDAPRDEFALACLPAKAPAMRVLQRGLLPVLEMPTLLALRRALLADDPRWRQGSTTVPECLEQNLGLPIRSACLLGMVAIVEADAEERVPTVREVTDRFAGLTVMIDAMMGEPAACRRLLDWQDDCRREVVRAGLLVELGKEIEARELMALHAGG